METGTPRGTLIRRVVLVTLAVAAVAWYARYGVRDHVWARNFAVVTPGEVYRSGRLTPAATRRVVERRGIRTIIDLGAYHPGSAEERLAQRTAEALGVTRYRLDLEGDATGNPNEYAHALRLIADPANRPVLVHCSAGSERTGCLVALYRAQTDDLDIEGSIDTLMAEANRHRDTRQPDLRGMLLTWGERILEAAASGTDVRGIEPTDAPVPVTHPEGRLPTDASFDADSPYKHEVPVPADEG
ncbi:MAG: tyrosine-protein phosphatase [Phycisphaerales bacterium]